LIELSIANLGRTVVVNDFGTRGRLVGYSEDGRLAYVEFNRKRPSLSRKVYAVYRLRWAGRGRDEGGGMRGG